MENWNALLYDAMRSKTTKLISAIYYISWIFIGNFEVSYENPGDVVDCRN
jgi:hypothetical protein